MFAYIGITVAYNDFFKFGTIIERIGTDIRYVVGNINIGKSAIGKCAVYTCNAVTDVDFDQIFTSPECCRRYRGQPVAGAYAFKL